MLKKYHKLLGVGLMLVLASVCCAFIAPQVGPKTPGETDFTGVFFGFMALVAGVGGVVAIAVAMMHWYEA